MKKDGVSTWKAAAAYIGTIVGAGFATGQEVLQFFTRFGVWGLAGLAVTTFLFIVFGAIIMDLGRQLHAQSHLEIIQFAGGKWLGFAIDGIVTFFLFGALTAMFAGSGALLEQQFHLPALFGVVIMGIITAFTVLKGINGVIDSISFVVPFLLLSVIGISIASLVQSPPHLSAAPEAAAGGGLVSNWLTAAVLYVSYNTIISIAVLGPLGVKARDRKAIRYGAILGGLGLGLGSLMIYLAISGDLARLAALEVPMIDIAGRLSPAVQIIYAIILLAEVYTTAVGSLYGLASRLVRLEQPPKKGRWVIIGATLAAMLASQFGFSNLVKYLYPMVGYAGILLLICLVYVKAQRKKVS